LFFLIQSFPKTSDILVVEFCAIYKSLLLTRYMSIDELVCYSDFLQCINFIKSLKVKYHIHIVLIQYIKESLSQSNVYLHHTLREGNQCADFFTKLGASSDIDFDVRDLFRNDTTGNKKINSYQNSCNKLHWWREIA
jgi:hypothetical protein